MKITPVLPNSLPPPAGQQIRTVAAVQPSARVDDAVGQAERRPTAPPTNQPAAVGPLDRAGRELPQGARANRALGAYAEVADGGQRSSLHQLLGFDAYA